jgi:hypothetical protein
MHTPHAGAGPSAAAPKADKSLLRFLTCGSVDDGKSTLIGRLLYDSKLIFDDQFSAIERLAYYLEPAPRVRASDQTLALRQKGNFRLDF